MPEKNMIPAWSYSSIKTFEQCPKKYYHLKIAKDVKDEGSTATIYGTELHTAAENFIKEATPIPARFAFLQPVLDSLSKIEGEKHCEIKMGVAKRDGKFAPCDFFAKDVWFRGVADLIILNEDKANIVDYKTGKSSQYADTKQLELMALAVFKHFPQVEFIKAGLAFLVAEDFVKANYISHSAPELWVGWISQINKLEQAHEFDVWNAKPNFTCRKFCSVLSCEHNGKGIYR
jgi:RecB family exonuclease